MGNFEYEDLEYLCQSGNARGIEEVFTKMGFKKKSINGKDKFLRRDRPGKGLVEYFFMELDGTYSFSVPQERSGMFESIYHHCLSTQTTNPEIPFMAGLFGGMMIGAKAAQTSAQITQSPCL